MYAFNHNDYMKNNDYIDYNIGDDIKEMEERIIREVSNKNKNNKINEEYDL